MSLDNFITKTDSYKVSHWRQYPPGTSEVYSYFEARGGEWAETVFFGLQYILQRHFEGRVVTKPKIDQAKRLFARHFGDDTLFNEKGWIRLLEKHDGYLPLHIRAVPEGTVVPTSNVLMTIVNTDPEFFWLTNYAETLLSQVWYPSTVATQSREWKKVINTYLSLTGTPETIDFKLQDFGYRGSTSHDSAAIGGAAHLVNFKGTDTLAAIELLEEYYGAEEMPGFSIPAAEHSTITSWGKDHEIDAYANMLDQFPTGLVAVVSDSYDVFKACADIWGGVLHETVAHRDGVTIIRPDSGHPPSTVYRILEILGERFGYSLNAKGYKVLPDYIRVIQGDGIDGSMIDSIYSTIVELGHWSADNLGFGSGGALLQKVNRDTSKYAFKCSEVTVDGLPRDVFKDPVTDKGKASKKGRLSLYRDLWKLEYYTGPEYKDFDVMQTVFLNGRMQNRTSLKAVRHNARL